MIVLQAETRETEPLYPVKHCFKYLGQIGFTTEDEAQTIHGASSLVTIANKWGLCIFADSRGIYFAETEMLRSQCVVRDKSNSEPAVLDPETSCIGRYMMQEGVIPYQLVLSPDELLLAVCCSCKKDSSYELLHFFLPYASGSVQPLARMAFQSRVRQLAWQPGLASTEVAAAFLLVLEGGRLLRGQLGQSSSELQAVPGLPRTTCVDWRADGSAFAAAAAGTVTICSPDGVPAAEIPIPSAGSVPQQIDTLRWLAGDKLFIGSVLCSEADGMLEDAPLAVAVLQGEPLAPTAITLYEAVPHRLPGGAEEQLQGAGGPLWSLVHCPGTKTAMAAHRLADDMHLQLLSVPPAGGAVQDVDIENDNAAVRVPGPNNEYNPQYIQGLALHTATRQVHMDHPEDPELDRIGPCAVLCAATSDGKLQMWAFGLCDGAEQPQLQEPRPMPALASPVLTGASAGSGTAGEAAGAGESDDDAAEAAARVALPDDSDSDLDGSSSEAAAPPESAASGSSQAQAEASGPEAQPFQGKPFAMPMSSQPFGAALQLGGGFSATVTSGEGLFGGSNPFLPGPKSGAAFQTGAPAADAAKPFASFAGPGASSSQMTNAAFPFTARAKPAGTQAEAALPAESVATGQGSLGSESETSVTQQVDATLKLAQLPAEAEAAAAAAAAARVEQEEEKQHVGEETSDEEEEEEEASEDEELYEENGDEEEEVPMLTRLKVAPRQVRPPGPRPRGKQLGDAPKLGLTARLAQPEQKKVPRPAAKLVGTPGEELERSFLDQLHSVRSTVASMKAVVEPLREGGQPRASRSAAPALKALEPEAMLPAVRGIHEGVQEAVEEFRQQNQAVAELLDGMRQLELGKEELLVHSAAASLTGGADAQDGGRDVRGPPLPPVLQAHKDAIDEALLDIGTRLQELSALLSHQEQELTHAEAAPRPRSRSAAAGASPTSWSPFHSAAPHSRPAFSPVLQPWRVSGTALQKQMAVKTMYEELNNQMHVARQCQQTVLQLHHRAIMLGLDGPEPGSGPGSAREPASPFARRGRLAPPDEPSSATRLEQPSADKAPGRELSLRMAGALPRMRVSSPFLPKAKPPPPPPPPQLPPQQVPTPPDTAAAAAQPLWPSLPPAKTTPPNLPSGVLDSPARSPLAGMAQPEALVFSSPRGAPTPAAAQQLPAASQAPAGTKPPLSSTAMCAAKTEAVGESSTSASLFKAAAANTPATTAAAAAAATAAPAVSDAKVPVMTAPAFAPFGTKQLAFSAGAASAPSPFTAGSPTVFATPSPSAASAATKPPVSTPPTLFATPAAPAFGAAKPAAAKPLAFGAPAVQTAADASADARQATRPETKAQPASTAANPPAAAGLAGVKAAVGPSSSSPAKQPAPSSKSSASPLPPIPSAALRTKAEALGKSSAAGLGAVGASTAPQAAPKPAAVPPPAVPSAAQLQQAQPDAKPSDQEAKKPPKASSSQPPIPSLKMVQEAQKLIATVAPAASESSSSAAAPAVTGGAAPAAAASAPQSSSAATASVPAWGTMAFGGAAAGSSSSTAANVAPFSGSLFGSGVAAPAAPAVPAGAAAAASSPALAFGAASSSGGGSGLGLATSSPQPAFGAAPASSPALFGTPPASAAPAFGQASGAAAAGSPFSFSSAASALPQTSLAATAATAASPAASQPAAAFGAPSPLGSAGATAASAPGPFAFAGAASSPPATAFAGSPTPPAFGAPSPAGGSGFFATAQAAATASSNAGGIFGSSPAPSTGTSAFGAAPGSGTSTGGLGGTFPLASSGAAAGGLGTGSAAGTPGGAFGTSSSSPGFGTPNTPAFSGVAAQPAPSVFSGGSGGGGGGFSAAPSAFPSSGAGAFGGGGGGVFSGSSGGGFGAAAGASGFGQPSALGSASRGAGMTGGMTGGMAAFGQASQPASAFGQAPVLGAGSASAFGAPAATGFGGAASGTGAFASAPGANPFSQIGGTTALPPQPTLGAALPGPSGSWQPRR